MMNHAGRPGERAYGRWLLLGRMRNELLALWQVQQYWINRHAGTRRGIGFELDDAVFELTRENLSILGLDIDLVHDSYDRGLRALGEPDEDLLIVFVAPP